MRAKKRVCGDLFQGEVLRVYLSPAMVELVQQQWDFFCRCVSDEGTVRFLQMIHLESYVGVVASLHTALSSSCRQLTLQIGGKRSILCSLYSFATEVFSGRRMLLTYRQLNPKIVTKKSMVSYAPSMWPLEK